MKMFTETSQNLSCCFVDRKSFSPGVPSLSLSPLLWLPVVPTISEGSSQPPPSPLSHQPFCLLPKVLPYHGGFPPSCPLLYSLMGASQGIHCGAGCRFPEAPEARSRANGDCCKESDCNKICPVIDWDSSVLPTSEASFWD